MRVVFVLAFLAMLSIAVNAYCPNLCSGHGSCGSNDKCTCYTQKGTASGYDGGGVAVARAAWTGADCSLRTCPVAVSWVGATAPGAGTNNRAGIKAAATSGHLITTLVATGADNKITTTCTAGEVRPATDYKKGDKIQVFSAANTLYYEYTVYSIACDTSGGTVGEHAILTYEEIDSAIAGGADNSFYVHFLGRDDDAANTLAKPATARGVHAVLECSGAGLCNRETGDCECFDGYGGEACSRTVCPSDCSGHGICVSMETLIDEAADEYSTEHALFEASAATDIVGWSTASMKKYNGWDKRKEFGCKCDAGFRGPDCSQQECPSYLDPMKGCGGGACNFVTGGSWSAIVPYDVSTATTSVDSGSGATVVKYSKCANTATGCSTAEQRDCSGRGICDYDSGSCNCFSGFYGEACEIQTILV